MARLATRHFRSAWRVFKPNSAVFAGCLLVLFASWVALELAVVACHRFGVAVNVALHLVFLLWFSGLVVGLHRMAIETLQGHVPRVRDLTGLLERAPTALLAFGIYAVAVTIGLALLVAPGVYVAVRYAFLGQVLATQPASAREALRAAAALSRGRWPAVGCVWLAGVALNLAGAALLGLGLLVTLPVSLLAMSSLYRSVRPP